MTCARCHEPREDPANVYCASCVRELNDLVDYYGIEDVTMEPEVNEDSAGIQLWQFTVTQKVDSATGRVKNSWHIDGDVSGSEIVGVLEFVKFDILAAASGDTEEDEF